MEIFKKLASVAFLFFFLAGIVRADCGETDYDCKVKFYTQKISETKNQEKTLSSEINLLDEKISLTRSQINLTQQQLGRLTDDISSVSGKIGFIEDSLATTANVLANRIAKTYIAGRTDPMVYLLTAADFSDFWQRLEYLRLVQKHDRQLLLQMAATRKNYHDQKDLLEDKKKQIEKLSAQLKAYKITLDKQNREKQQLLAVTQNNEAQYASLLAQAKAQLAAFSGFVSGQGGLTLVDADPSWPKDYYSQRDKRWGNIPIAGYYPPGAKIYSIGEAGCLITSVAMTATHRGDNISPVTIGSNGDYFFDALFSWDGLRARGLNTILRTTDRSVIDNALNAGKWVILGISYANSVYSQPFHFVVATAKNGGDYNLFDPWRGPNISFNSNYGGNYITEVITY